MADNWKCTPAASSVEGRRVLELSEVLRLEAITNQTRVFLKIYIFFKFKKLKEEEEENQKNLSIPQERRSR